MHHQITKILIDLRTGGKAAIRAAQLLRTNADVRDQIDLLAQLPPGHPELRNLTGICFASGWKELWVPNQSPRISNSQKAINWFTAVSSYHAEALRRHAIARSSLIHAVLHGRWKEAQETLERHQGEFGPTLWGMAWLFLIVEESGGSTVRLNLVERFRDEQYGYAAPVFAGFYSLSVDKTLPEEHFRSALQDYLKGCERTVRQFLEFHLFEDCSTPWKAWELLELSEFLPLVDRYEFFIRLTSIAFASEQEDAVKLVRASSRLARLCSDSYFNYFAECAEKDSPITFCEETAQLLCAWDAYLASDYSKSFELAAAVADRRPELVSAHEILVKSAMYSGKTDLLNGTTPLALLWQHLRNILSKNEQSEDSLNYLLRFGSRFRIFPITAPLRALHAQHSMPYPEDKWHRRGACSMGVHGPRNFEYGHTAKINEDYLVRCQVAFPESIAIRFFSALMKGVSGLDVAACDAIPQIRRLFFGGLAAARRNQYHEALQYLDKFLLLQATDPTNPLSPFAIEEARRVLIDLYRINGDAVQMQRVVVQSFLDRPQSVRRLPIRRVFEASLENKTEAGRHIEFPIIAYLACDNPQDVALALKRFMRASSVEKPTELLRSESLDTRTLAVLFLRVCTPEVLDSLLSLDLEEKVEAERLALLDWVTKHAPNFSRVAQAEVLRLTQQAELRDALQKIEGARVGLNLSGLREAEQEHFSDAYFRYAAQRELANAQTKDELTKAFQVLHRSGGTYVVVQAEALIGRQETAYNAFAAAFRAIRDAFVSSPHFGIEASLSGRIRHGILIQHIRKPLVEGRMAVRKDAPERPEVEKFWRSKLSTNDNHRVESVMAILFKLTGQINSIAEEVKSLWIQSKTETRNPQGIFDYSFSDEQLRIIAQTRFHGTTGVETFLDSVFDVLLERTRDSLRAVRDRIDSDLRNRLGNAVDEAIREVVNLDDDRNLLPLRNALTVCRQDTEQTCRQMSRWFQGTDATLMGDAKFDLVARTAVGMVERLNPDFRGRHKITVESEYRVTGRHFTALVHILFFLLDNAIKHSDVLRERFASSVRIRTESNEIFISVENQMSSIEAAAAAAERIHDTFAALQTALDPDTVVREGGSGFAKVIAAVRYGFKQHDPTVVAKGKGDRLEVVISCEATGLTV